MKIKMYTYMSSIFCLPLPGKNSADAHVAVHKDYFPVVEYLFRSRIGD